MTIGNYLRKVPLEVRALAESGLALISLGRTREGLNRLDEALAAVISGEVHDLVTGGPTCCAVVTACERLGDIDRVTHLVDSLCRMADERFHGFESPILTSHCSQAYGGMLCEAGRWQEAELELRRALTLSNCPGHRAAAAGRLAELRIQQNRIPEAAELLAGWEDRLEAAAPLARLHDACDELDLAASTLRRALREQERATSSFRRRSSPTLSRWRADAASWPQPTRRPRAWKRLPGRSPPPWCAALALLSRGRVQMAHGEDAEASLVAALRALSDTERPRLRGEIHLALATAKRDRDPAAATIEARAGLAVFERLGSRRDVDRAAALLRSLGVSVRAGAAADPGRGREVLSRREREVVPLLAESLSNSEIARRLFVTPKPRPAASPPITPARPGCPACPRSPHKTRSSSSTGQEIRHPLALPGLKLTLRSPSFEHRIDDANQSGAMPVNRSAIALREPRLNLGPAPQRTSPGVMNGRFREVPATPLTRDEHGDRGSAATAPMSDIGRVDQFIRCNTKNADPGDGLHLPDGRHHSIQECICFTGHCDGGLTATRGNRRIVQAGVMELADDLLMSEINPVDRQFELVLAHSPSPLVLPIPCSVLCGHPSTARRIWRAWFPAFLGVLKTAIMQSPWHSSAPQWPQGKRTEPTEKVVEIPLATDAGVGAEGTQPSGEHLFYPTVQADAASSH
jgi:hypothetical protein